MTNPALRASLLCVLFGCASPVWSESYAIEREREVLDDREAFRSFLEDLSLEGGDYQTVQGASAFYGDVVEIVVSRGFLDLSDERQSTMLRALVEYWSTLTPEHTAHVNLFISGTDLPYRSTSFRPDVAASENDSY